MTDFELSQHDKNSGLWLRLSAYLEDRLTNARRRNDRPLSEAETATLRGEIDCLKKILALGEDPPMTGDEDQPPEGAWMEKL